MITYVDTANKGTVNLREGPSKSTKILAKIPNKTQLETEYYDSTWSKTNYDGWDGYVMTEFLSSGTPVTKNDLQQIYNGLKEALNTIEKILA